MSESIDSFGALIRALIAMVVAALGVLRGQYLGNFFAQRKFKSFWSILLSDSTCLKMANKVYRIPHDV